MANSRKRRSSDPLAEAARVLGALDVAGRTLCVGLSGGVDSVVLLKLLRNLQPRLGFILTAIHVNHGLSPHASQWEVFCANLCKRWKIAFAVERVKVRKTGQGLEAEARAQRYRAFSMHAADFMLLAHHLDDQAETMLLLLLRGAGVRGLAAMPEVSHGSQLAIPVVRPLLAVTRTDILGYARRHRLTWVEDESNDEIALRRNFLRHRVLPEISVMFPAYREALARSAAHFGEAAAVLEDLGFADAGLQRQATRLDCNRLRKLSPPRAANALRVFLAANGLLAPDTARLGEMLRQLLGARRDAGIKLLHDGVELRRYRDMVWILKPRPATANPVLSWRGESMLELDDGAGALVFRRSKAGRQDRNDTAIRISAAKFAQHAVSVRWRKGGEKFQPQISRPRRSLKHLLQDAALPPWEREILPLLYCGETLVWVPGIGVDARFQAAAQEAAWFVSWRRLHYTQSKKFRAPRSR
jgi:tRNA(Ile)-lysidine synthase